MENKEFDKIIGERIKKARKRLNLTQEDVAAALGMTCSGLSRIETGKNSLNLEYVGKLSEILQVAPENFLTSWVEFEDRLDEEVELDHFFRQFLSCAGIDVILVPNDDPRATYYKEIGAYFAPDGEYAKSVFCYKGAMGREEKRILTYGQEKALQNMVVSMIKQSMDVLPRTQLEEIGISEEAFSNRREIQRAAYERERGLQ